MVRVQEVVTDMKEDTFSDDLNIRRLISPTFLRTLNITSPFTSYLSHPEDRHFFSGSIKSRSGSRAGDSGLSLDMISYHNFCPDRNTKFP